MSIGTFGQAVRSGRRSIRRLVRSPFPPGTARLLVVHACHHKAGTVWFRNILLDIADQYGLRFDHADHRGTPRPRTDLFLQDHSKVDRDALPPFRGSHVVRDPRDIVVSAYHYHLWTEEPWAHVPKEIFGGRSYQEELKRLPPDEGLLLEIEHTGFTIEDMRAWDYDDPRFLEVRFEELLADEMPTFEQIFRHWGFSDDAVAESLAAAERHTFIKAKSRESGDGPSHLRKGGGRGEWRELFDDRHHARIQDLCGDLLVRMGYETSPPR